MEQTEQETEQNETKSDAFGVANAVKEALRQMLDKMGFEAKVVTVLATDEQITLDIQSPELGLLIGNEGETLNALQTLLRGLVTKQNPNRIPILLDAEGYRERRAQVLRERAQTIKEKVKATGKEAVMEGLTAYERRIVHLSLANDPDVVTYSEGEGAERNLVISPGG